MDTPIVIIGGGLSGLALAEQLTQRGQDYILIEARTRFGGRILTKTQAYDMGPAWYWPGQPRMAHLVDRLRLRRFDQYAEGTLTYENEHGEVLRGQGYASMQGSYRIDGGMGAVIEALVAKLPKQNLRLNAQLLEIERQTEHLCLTLSDGSRMTTKHAVFALPPRVIAETITFNPPLPDQASSAMQDVATWMAGQAKAVAVYDTAFWRQEGLSGDAMSRIGPMVELHDASPMDDSSGALFGFIGVPPTHRTDQSALRAAILAQLGRLFGPQASQPRQLFVKDWAYDALTATATDQQPMFSHPSYGVPKPLINLWDGTLSFAGTECAPQFGGYLEGALEASENALYELESCLERAE